MKWGLAASCQRQGAGGKLCSVPARDQPDGFILAPIKEAVRRNDHFAKGKIREFRDEATGSRKPGETPEGAFSFPEKP